MKQKAKANSGLSQPIGGYLRKARKKKGLSLKAAAESTNLRLDIIKKMEANEFDSLPHTSYTQGFLRQYANFLGVKVNKVMDQYEIDRGPLATTTLKTRPVKVRRSLAGAKAVRWVAAFVILTAISGYVLLQFARLASAPRLDIEVPANDLIVKEASITVKGSTSPGAEVKINATPILTNPDGTFTTDVSLQQGVNNLEIIANNSLGKKAVEHRTVIAEY